MKSGNTDTTTSLAILVQGSPKTGKTELACLFPTPFIVNGDNNLDGFRRRAKAQNFKHDWFFDNPATDAQGRELPVGKRWERCVALCKEAALDPAIKTIVLDSITTVLLYGTEAVVSKRALDPMSKNKEPYMSLADWQPYYSAVKQLIMTLRTTGKIVVALSHEEPEKDETSGGIVKWMPNVPGRKLQMAFAGFFSDTWRTEIEGLGANAKYIVRTKPTARLDLGGAVQTKTETFVRPDSLAEQQKIINALLKGE